MSLYPTQKKPIKEIKISSNLSVGLFDDGRIMTMIRGVPFVQCRGAIVNLKASNDQEAMDAFAERLSKYKNTDEFLANRTPEEKDLDVAHHNRLEPEEELKVHAGNIQAWYENNYNLDLIDSRIAFPILNELMKYETKAKRAFYYEVERRWIAGSDLSKQALMENVQAREFIDAINSKQYKNDKIRSLPQKEQVKLASIDDLDKKTIDILSKSPFVSVRSRLSRRHDLDKATSLLLSKDINLNVRISLSKSTENEEIIEYIFEHEKNIDVVANLVKYWRKKSLSFLISKLKTFDNSRKRKLFDALMLAEDASDDYKRRILAMASELHITIDSDSTGALLNFLGRGEEHTPAKEEIANEMIEKKIARVVGKKHDAINAYVHDMIVKRYSNENEEMKQTIIKLASYDLDLITKLVESGNVEIKDMTPEEISIMIGRGDVETGKYLSFFIQHLHELWNAADIYGKQNLIKMFGNELEYLGDHDVINYTCHRARITAEKARAVTMNNFYDYLSPVLAAKLKAIKLNTRSGELIALTKDSLNNEKQGILKLKPFSETSVLFIKASPKNYVERHFKLGMIKLGFLYPYSEVPIMMPGEDKDFTYSMSGRDIEKFCTSIEPKAWLEGLMHSIVDPPKAFFLIYFPFELHLSFTIAWNETAFEGLSKKSIWSLESFVMADIIDNLRKRVGMQPFFNIDVHKLIVQRKG